MSSASLPVLGNAVPRSGGPVSRAFGRLLLRVLGWRVEGELPNERKFVIIAAPHTSNWDFFIGMGAKLALGIAVVWIGKHTIFVWPVTGLLRSLGGLPVNRSAPQDIVQQIVAEFGRREEMVFALAPEGTRKKVERWKTGYWHIAHAARVPIVPAAFDWERRTVILMPAFATTSDVDADTAALREKYAKYRGKPR